MNPVSIEYEAAWAPEPVRTLWKRHKNLAHNGNRTVIPTLPALPRTGRTRGGGGGGSMKRVLMDYFVTLSFDMVMPVLHNPNMMRKDTEFFSNL
jgi:hypothetical protein